jgi:uncharacterized protein YlxP (DUF503 family)
VFVVVVRCELHLPGARSLKAKRAVLNRLKDRLRGSGPVAVAEVDHNDLWQRAALGLAVVSGSAGHADELTAALRSVVERETEAVLLEWQEERY